VKEAIKVIRTERHDFLNHLQVISGLLQLKKEERALEYIGKITEEIYDLGKITRINDSKLATSILLKNYEAHEKGIKVNLDIQTQMDGLKTSGELLSEKIRKIFDVFFVVCTSIDAKVGNEINLSIKEDEEEESYLLKMSSSPVNIDENLKQQLVDLMQELKEENINIKQFDTDKKVRVYLSFC